MILVTIVGRFLILGGFENCPSRRDYASEYARSRTGGERMTAKGRETAETKSRGITMDRLLNGPSPDIPGTWEGTTELLSSIRTRREDFSRSVVRNRSDRIRPRRRTWTFSANSSEQFSSRVVNYIKLRTRDATLHADDIIMIEW